MSGRSVPIPWRHGTRSSRERPAGPARARLAAVPLMLARAVLAVAVLIALLIGLAIVLRDVDANARNTIVKGIHDGANFFAGAFTGLATFHGHPKRAITVDWGIALVAYLLAGAIVAAGVSRVGRRARTAPTPAAY